VKGAAGEIGLMQVMPPTAQMLGFQGGKEQLADPAVNIALGVRYLAEANRLAGGDLCTTVMKYRAGHGETRFSARSVAYCLRARKILGRDGYEVTGEVPAVTLAPVRPASVRASQLSAASGVCVTSNSVVGPHARQCNEYSSVGVTRHTLAPG
jgi:soluble lytic murein transglycosylase-like protein